MDKFLDDVTDMFPPEETGGMSARAEGDSAMFASNLPQLLFYAITRIGVGVVGIMAVQQMHRSMMQSFFVASGVCACCTCCQAFTVFTSVAFLSVGGTLMSA